MKTQLIINIKLLCGYAVFSSHSHILDLITKVTLISIFTLFLKNFIISNIISIYLGSNFVFDLIYLHTALDILYTSFSSFKYVYFFFNNNNYNIF